MNKIIWKFPLLGLGHNIRKTVKVGERPFILTAQIQDGIPVVWISSEVSDDPNWEPTEEVVLCCFGTGHPMPKETDEVWYNYICTVQTGPFAWHLYEEIAVECE